MILNTAKEQNCLSSYQFTIKKHCVVNTNRCYGCTELKVRGSRLWAIICVFFPNSSNKCQLIFQSCFIDNIRWLVDCSSSQWPAQAQSAASTGTHLTGTLRKHNLFTKQVKQLKLNVVAILPVQHFYRLLDTLNNKWLYYSGVQYTNSMYLLFGDKVSEFR